MRTQDETINMKKNILLFLMTILFFTASDAQALLMVTDKQPQERHEEDCVDGMNFYAKVFSGPNFLQNTTIEGNKAAYNTGYVISGSLGYCWPCGLRLEAEYAFRRNGIRNIHFVGQGSSKHGYFEASSYMANLSSWGCPLWNIQAFVGAGIGYDFQHMHSSNSLVIFNQKWNQFSWQLMTGLVYPIFRNTELTLEYKFHQGGSHFYNHSIGIGLVYKFGFLR